MRILWFVISATSLHLVLLALSLDNGSGRIDDFRVGVGLVERQMDLFSPHAPASGSTTQPVVDQTDKVSVAERKDHRKERTEHEVAEDSGTKQEEQLVEEPPPQMSQRTQLLSEEVLQGSPEEMSSLPTQGGQPVSTKVVSKSEILQVTQGRLSSAKTTDGAGTAAPGEVTGLQVSAQPSYGYQPAPSYPGIARRRGWEGSVEFKVRVLASGEVAELILKNSSGYKILDAAARRAIVRWRFTPAQQDGRVVESWVVVPVHFVLDAQARSR